MPNSFYNGGTFPATGTAATSAPMRAEFASIAAGFDKMPALSAGVANYLIAVNSLGTALEAKNSFPLFGVVDNGFTITDELDATKILKFQVNTITTGNTRTLTVPDASTTLVGTDTTQTLTAKTLTTPVLSGTASGTTSGRLGYSGGVFSYGDGTNQRVVVNTDEAQTLTNKTLTTPVLSATAAGTTAGRLGYASGVFSYGDGANQRAVVNTDEAQTLTNKTLTTPVLSGTGAGATAGQVGYSSGVVTFGNGSAIRTVATLEDSQTLTGAKTFTGANSFQNATGQTFLASSTSTHDGLVITGRAGGSLSYRLTLSPATLGANRSVTFPDAAGSVVIDTATQTLTNKTIAFGSNTLTDVAGVTAAQTLTNKTLTSPTLTSPTLNDGYTEEVYSIPSSTTPALSPANGSIQTWTLTGNSTPTAGTWADGQSLTLLIDDGTARTITWTSVSVTWKTNLGNAPTLNTSGFTVIQLWKVGSTIYGARVGDA